VVHRVDDVTASRSLKRSNKDLASAIAFAWLATRKKEHALLAWPQAWAPALRQRFSDARKLPAARAGNGLRQMLASPADLEEAAHSRAYALLARRSLSV
jgi:hypothetical protein